MKIEQMSTELQRLRHAAVQSKQNCVSAFPADYNVTENPTFEMSEASPPAQKKSSFWAKRQRAMIPLGGKHVRYAGRPSILERFGSPDRETDS
jgi:hypothetical protein